MKFESISKIVVYFMRKQDKLLVGHLLLQQRKILFEYTSQFIKTGIELSPFKLPLKPGIYATKDFLFDGLFGLFNDSLPDGWGRLLLDRKLNNLGINPGELSPLDRLRYVGNSGMGALSYAPEITTSALITERNLDKIAEKAYAFDEHDDDRFVDDLLSMNGSSAGARPKILINMNEEAWLVKFRSSVDPKDIGPIEYAYHLMARNAGLDIPTAKLFPSKKGPGFFGTKRFDRQNNNRIHMHTLSGLLHADHRLPSLDYESILKATAWLTKDAKEAEKQFRASVFNILSHNRDDHAKNFSFLMDSEGKWFVSPAYDLTFSSGPAGEHCSTIMGEGKNPQKSHLLQLAKIINLDDNKTLNILQQAQEAVSKWSFFAKEAGVSTSSSNMISKSINRILKDMKK